MCIEYDGNCRRRNNMRIVVWKRRGPSKLSKIQRRTQHSERSNRAQGIHEQAKLLFSISQQPIHLLIHSHSHTHMHRYWSISHSQSLCELTEQFQLSNSNPQRSKIYKKNRQQDEKKVIVFCYVSRGVVVAASNASHPSVTCCCFFIPFYFIFLHWTKRMKQCGK